ncbi:INPP5B_F [Mytilus coruscus]|uniref:INPP5B_F n=1 Tax=Mytilus coruscus TaxID=42192 RepID=A0A6J8EBH3_MYTCO|nr:INPP5B_F [Mytilus coruscus]
METPRRKIRTSTQAPMVSQVRQNCLRNQIFSPAGSGLGSSPATGTLHDVHTETMPDIRYRRRIGHCSPRNNQDRAVQEMSNTEKDGGNCWKKFWQIWVSLLTLSSGLVASAWIYFPNNRVVQKSQEYVMIGLLAIICLIISTIVLKFVWNSVISGYKAENTVYTWSRNRRSPNHMYNGLSRTPDNVITETDTPYDSDEMPSYSCPRCNRPVINGQRQMELESPGQTSENMGLSLGHVQLPESDSLLQLVFWLGDLNYRLNDLDRDKHDKVKTMIQNSNFKELMSYDQLHRQLGRTDVFKGYSEAVIEFKPTYKYDINSDDWDSSLHYISVSGNYIASSFGSSLEALIQMHGPVREIPTAQLVEIEQPGSLVKRDVLNQGGSLHAIPKEIWRLVDHLLEYGCDQEDLFQQPGLNKEIQQIRDCLDTGTPDKIPGSIHSIAEGLLLFLESLPDPVIPKSVHRRCLECSNNYLLCKQIIMQIPEYHRNVFKYLCEKIIIPLFLEIDNADRKLSCENGVKYIVGKGVSAKRYNIIMSQVSETLMIIEK